MPEPEKLRVKCPACDARLVVDAATGEVVAHRKPKEPVAGGKDFEQLLENLDRERSEAEEVFQREVTAMKDRDRLLEEKFQQALKRAEEEPDDLPPPRPWELD